jgi:hypothetical protein
MKSLCFAPSIESKRRWMEFSPPTKFQPPLDVERSDDPAMLRSHVAGEFSPPTKFQPPLDGVFSANHRDALCERHFLLHDYLYRLPSFKYPEESIL